MITYPLEEQKKGNMLNDFYFLCNFQDPKKYVQNAEKKQKSQKCGFV